MYGEKTCVWKLKKKPIFAINILCLTWTRALFLPDVGKGSQSSRAPLKAGQQGLAACSPQMAPALGNPAFPATVGSRASSWAQAGPVLFSSALSSSQAHEQFPQHCVYNRKRGKVFQGVLWQRGGCQGQELASPLPGPWPQVGEMWVLLLRKLRKKHFACTPKQVPREQGQKPAAHNHGMCWVGKDL